MTNWQDDETIVKMIREMVEKELKTIDKSVPRHLAGNKFQVPTAMREWWDRHYDAMGGRNDFYYRSNVGYGAESLVVDWVFSKNSITLTFNNPYGERMFILELLRDALYQERKVLLSWRQEIHPQANRRYPLRKAEAPQA